MLTAKWMTPQIFPLLSYASKILSIDERSVRSTWYRSILGISPPKRSFKL